MLGVSETLRMMKYAISPLTDLFGEWGLAVEKVFGGFKDNRAAMLQIMMEIGAVAAILVYGIAFAIATVLRFIVTLANTMIDVILGPNLERLVSAIEFIQNPLKGPKDWIADKRTSAGTTGPGGYSWSHGLAAAGTMIGAGAGIAASIFFPVISPFAPAAGAAGGGLIGAGIGELIDLGYTAWAGANGLKIPSYGYGGNVSPGSGMMLVGERGPELFVPPRMGGEVLNSDRTRNLLDGQRSGSIMGQGMVNQMIVTNLVSENSVSNQSKISVDTFAGVV